MKYSLLLSLFVFELVLSQGSANPNVVSSNSPSKCTKPNLRKEIRQLSDAELSTYQNAIKTLSVTLDPSTGLNKFDKLTQIHVESYRLFHNTPYFLLWHRHILITYEILLKSVAPDIVLPYWDWSIESNQVSESSVLSSKYVGGDGNPNYDNCVLDGPFSQLLIGYPFRKCLQRKYDLAPKISNLGNRLDIEALLNESSFSQFSYQVEILHGGLHSHLGGDMSEKFSTNDPLFYLHHTFLDRIFYEWQMRHPQAQFEGYKYNKQVSLYDQLPVFQTRCGYLWNTFNPNLCYGYLRFPDTFTPPTLSFGIDSSGGKSRSFKFNFKDLFRTLLLLPKVQNKTMDEAIDELQKKNKNKINSSNSTDIVGPSNKWLLDNGFDVQEATQLVKKRNLFQRLLFWDSK